MVIRPANRDTKKRGEFVKGEKTDRERGGGGERFQNTFLFFLLNQRRNKGELRKLYMQAKRCFSLRKEKKKKAGQHQKQVFFYRTAVTHRLLPSEFSCSFVYLLTKCLNDPDQGKKITSH